MQETWEYPSDGARHSFGTYGYWHRGVEWTMHTMGHSNYDTFQRYYRNKDIRPEDAKAFFSI